MTSLPPLTPNDALLLAPGLVAVAQPLLGDITLVVVDGPSGSGKTTFAQQLAEALGDVHQCRPGHAADQADVALLSTDYIATWDEPFSWWPELECGVLQPLAAGRPGILPAQDWSAGQPVRTLTVPVPVCRILVLEGVSASRMAVTGRASLRIWVELPGQSRRLERAVARDGEAARVHLAAWQHAESAFFARDGAAARADLVVAG